MKRALLAIAVVAVAAAGTAVALYGISFNGNDATSAEWRKCEVSIRLARRIDGFMKGEVAALSPAKAPVDLGALSFQDANGKTMTVADVPGDLKLLNLWATWCVPCRSEMPALDALESDLGGKGFAVVPVNIDRAEPERPRQFLSEIKVKHLPFFTDRTMDIFNEMKKKGLAVGLPVTALVDRGGCLVAHMNGPAEWDSADAKLLIETALQRLASPNQEGPGESAPAGS